MANRKPMDGREAARIMYGGSGMQEIIKKLTAPWDKKEVKWRVGSISKSKPLALPLAYVDARNVMERLDDAVGAENWQDRYEFHGSRIICYLSLRIGDEWICKSDGAGDSAVEAEKGGISDAFKRAAVKWGMGRELYDLKCRWQPIDNFKKLVGNSWDYVIKGAAEDEPEPTENPKPIVKPEPTKAQKDAAAKETAIKIKEAYKICKDFAALSDCQKFYKYKLQRLDAGYPELYKEVSVVALDVLASFDNHRDDKLDDGRQGAFRND